MPHPGPHSAMASVRAASEVLDSTIQDLFLKAGKVERTVHHKGVDIS